MISRDELVSYGWSYSKEHSTNNLFYDSWEYEFIINCQELYYINDGMDEPVFIANVRDIETLLELYFILENKEMVKI